MALANGYLGVCVIIVLSGCSSSNNIENAEAFREAATRILVIEGLQWTRPGTFVCIDVEQHAPGNSSMKEFMSLKIREVGVPAECVCASVNGEQVCSRKGSEQPACMLSVSNFSFSSAPGSSASLFVSCGWPRGMGWEAEFSPAGGKWVMSSIRATATL